MVQYPCLLWTQVVGVDGEDFGQREIALPFVPMAGLQLDGVIRGFTAPETVEEVVWDHEQQWFRLHLPMDRSNQDTLEQIKRAYGADWLWGCEPRRDKHPLDSLSRTNGATA